MYEAQLREDKHLKKKAFGRERSKGERETSLVAMSKEPWKQTHLASKI